MAKDEDSFEVSPTDVKSTLARTALMQVMLFEAVRQIGGEKLDIERVRRAGEAILANRDKGSIPEWHLELAVDEALLRLGVEVEDLGERAHINMVKLERSRMSKSAQD